MTNDSLTQLMVGCINASLSEVLFQPDSLIFTTRTALKCKRKPLKLKGTLERILLFDIVDSYLRSEKAEPGGSVF